MSKEVGWQCHKCTYINPASGPRCDQCGFRREVPRPSSSTEETQTGAQQQTSASTGTSAKLERGQLEEIISIASAMGQETVEGSWECTYCTNLNPPNMSNCCACFAEPPPEFWSILRENQMQNQSDVGAERTQVSGISDVISDYLTWSCPTCTFENQIDYTLCDMCKQPRPNDVKVPTIHEQEEFRRLLAEQMMVHDDPEEEEMEDQEEARREDDGDDDDDDAWKTARTEYPMEDISEVVIKRPQEAGGRFNEEKRPTQVMDHQRRPNTQPEDVSTVSMSEQKGQHYIPQMAPATESEQNLIKKTIFDAVEDLNNGRSVDAKDKLMKLLEHGFPVYLKAPVATPNTETCFLEVNVCFRNDEFIFFKRFNMSETVKDLKHLTFLRYSIHPERQTCIVGARIVQDESTFYLCGVNESPMLFPIKIYVDEGPIGGPVDGE